VTVASGTTVGSTNQSTGNATKPGTVPTSAATPTSPTPSVSTSIVKKSISNWVGCSGVADDFEGAARAFADARHGAFTLVVDCPVYLHSGLDISRVIYIDDGTSVEFTTAGKLIVDNVMHPVFVIANSVGITLINWNVEYDASLPVNPAVGGYGNNGQFVSVAGHSQPSSAWNDLGITSWLTANRAIVFDQSQGSARSWWVGTTNACAIFFITGDTSNVTISGMSVYVPTTATGDRFAPVVFQMSPNYKSGQTVTAKTARTPKNFAVPHDLTFSNIVLDGTYMGWVGGAQNVVFENIESHRYGDLQDSKGENVGGVGKWFAPPHLFYLVYDTTEDPALFNTNIRIDKVSDLGPRIGVARDRGGNDTISGYALSIKIACNGCSVSNYVSRRPDGFMDVLYSDGLSVSNVTANYDSSFINNLYPAWRFPSSPYANLTFENIALFDNAVTSMKAPIGNATLDSDNKNIVLSNVHVTMNRWAGPTELPLPSILGDGNQVALDFMIVDQGLHIVGFQAGTDSLTLQGAASSLKVDSSTVLTWKSLQASTCSASGAWSGTIATSGSQKVKLASAGANKFSLNCRGPSLASAVTLPIIVQ
jgi:hypothetical protein